MSDAAEEFPLVSLAGQRCDVAGLHAPIGTLEEVTRRSLISAVAMSIGEVGPRLLVLSSWIIGDLLN